MTTPRPAERKRTYKPRPWRAVAFVPDPSAPNGRRREIAGKTSATTEDGLIRFVRRHRAAGHKLDVFRVQGIDEL